MYHDIDNILQQVVVHHLHMSVLCRGGGEIGDIGRVVYSHM